MNHIFEFINDCIKSAEDHNIFFNIHYIVGVIEYSIKDYIKTDCTEFIEDKVNIDIMKVYNELSDFNSSIKPFGIEFDININISMSEYFDIIVNHKRV